MRVETLVFWALLVFVAALTAATVSAVTILPPSALVVPVLIGGLLLGTRLLLLLYAAVAAALAVEVSLIGLMEARPGSVIVVAATAVVALGLTRERSRLGLQGVRGDTMLVDLRDRLRAQGELPPLPPGWQAEVVLRSAGGASFGGDFLVAASPAPDVLELALVDVSGKGVAAGTRALLLSGAFGGLLGAMPDRQFLPAANRYLLAQGWEEGFATAAHLVVHLGSGRFVVTLAGHPPAAHFVARTGRWAILDSGGPLLGVLPDATFRGRSGELAAGDALLLFTDGVVEGPGRDLDSGLDRLVGQAERLVTRGFRGGAKALLDAAASGGADDRALVLLWRAPAGG